MNFEILAIYFHTALISEKFPISIRKNPEKRDTETGFVHTHVKRGQMGFTDPRMANG
jgi:hypothetical protein